MDSDNPWGAGSTNSSPNLKSSTPPTDQAEDAPRLSLEVEEEDASWGNDTAEVGSDKRDVEEETKEEKVDEAEPIKGEDSRESTEVEEAQHQDSNTVESETEDSSSQIATTSKESANLPPPVPTVSEESTTTTTEELEEQEPPMDEFPEDDDAFSSTSASPPSPSKPSESFTIPPPAPIASAGPSEAPPMDDFDDFDDDDFGEMGEAVDGGDDDDFGDFGDSAPLDESAFDTPPPALLTTPTRSFSESQAPTQPVPSTSFLPPLRLDLSNRPTRSSVAPQLREFVSTTWGDLSDKVTDEPERQVEGVAQILVTEESRNLLSNLSSLPPLRPLDWKRSKIRREHLISMGIPVNLDDANDSKPVSSLSISSPRLSGSLARPSSAPPGSSPLPFSSSRVPSRSSTPFADRERTRRSASPPPLDKTLANQLLALKEDDLTLLSLEKLKNITAELEKISVEASEVLTHALLMREKESQDKETYNGMISDLVSAAAKMKTTSSASSAGRGKDPKRQGSIRWGRG
ncbi:hypothetical protein JCM3765_000439 [Sporobolomyces pararoseus]